jgi:acyl-CoA synthetase (AMP-forming)/AMP-acid ligase II
MEHLADILVTRARTAPDGVYFWFEGEPFGYADVLAGALRFRGRLEALAVAPGAPVLLLAGNGPLFFHAFFGALLHGAIPVPIAPHSPRERVRALVDDCRGALAVGDADANAALQGAADAGIPVLPAEDALAPQPSTSPLALGPSAFVQYTSGTTGRSRGARVSQRAVLANVRAFTRRLEAGPGDAFSSMMPLFHDMGLVCFGLAPLCLGAPVALLRAEAVSLYRWLEGIGERRVTITGGPNTFLRLANRVVRDPGRYDLSSLRALVCGSEPVFADVVEQFEASYRVPGVVKPAYGMAELTLCVTLTGASERYALHRGRTVSCGRPLPGVRVAIDAGEPTVEPYAEGEILVDSPARMDGYVGDAPSGPSDPGYFATGDVGFLDEEGRLYVVGRKKNLVIRGGLKLAPAELEALAARQEEVSLAAAVGVNGKDDRGERLALVVEVARNVLEDGGARRRIARELVRAAQRQLTYRPDLVVFSARGRIPLALNGKIQHGALREQLSTGTYPAVEMLHGADLV